MVLKGRRIMRLASHLLFVFNLNGREWKSEVFLAPYQNTVCLL